MITGKTKVCCLIGDPIEHSFSPTMWNAAFAKMKLDYTYVAFRVRSEQLREAVKGLRALEAAGFNVTVPHKMAVMQYLDEIDAVAQNIGAVNTVTNKNRKLIGYNTDGMGAARAMQENKINVKGKVVLVGAGGAARAISFSIAPKCDEIRIFDIDANRAKHLAAELLRKANVHAKGFLMDQREVKKELEEASLLINATPIGMHPNINASPVGAASLHSSLSVFDVIYNPRETLLIKSAKKLGCKTATGELMLLYQAVEGFKLVIGKSPPVNVMKKALLSMLVKK